jgi:hypothetical protein
MRFLIAAVALACAPALAEELVYRDGGVSVHLQNKACESVRVQTLAQAIAELAGQRMGAGYVMFQGRRIHLCWTVKDSSVLLIDEDGDGGTIPIASFKLDAGI